MGIVTALVCTRDRPESLVRAVRSLLASSDVQFELVVVDQSDDLKSAQALAPFASDARLRYVRSAARGAGAALNEGLRLARGEILACTDDDCEALPDWLAGMVRILGEQPTAAIKDTTAGSCARSWPRARATVSARGWFCVAKS